MTKSVPHAKTITAFLIAKNWTIDGIEIAKREPFFYLLKPPSNLGIIDKSFRYKVYIHETTIPAYWDYLNAIAAGIATIYQIEKKSLDKLLFKPLDLILEDSAELEKTTHIAA